jgi:competence protein ComEA
MQPHTDFGRWLVHGGAWAAAGLLVALSPAAEAFPTSKAAASGTHGSPGAPATVVPSRVRLVNINSASRAELKTLPGIGDAEAERIVANRPYATKTHLVEKQVLGMDTYEKLRSVIVVEHRRPSLRQTP